MVQSHSRTVAQSHSRTVAQSHSRTVAQSHSRDGCSDWVTIVCQSHEHLPPWQNPRSALDNPSIC
ncbi:MAG: hypothetical protein EBZ75_04245 [Oxalobacteraceae bacterium]|nr:hypothetical protein [Oxalobacteraceae bacterium]